MKIKRFTGLAYAGLRMSLTSLVLSALLFSEIGIKSAHAATTWTVTSLLDDGTIVGTCPDVTSCRLRTAIFLASDDDTIIFSPGLSGQAIHLASTLIISKNITIDASALETQITISGDTDSDDNNDVRIFAVTSGVTATLRGMILTKGKSPSFGGGAILNAGTLTVDHCTISASTAIDHGGGAILNWDGTLTITNSSINGNGATIDSRGGGVNNFGTLVVTNSVFSNNYALDTGGAIFNVVEANITNTFFSGNTANTGGAISSDATVLNVTNSTFSSNGSILSGGGMVLNGPATIANSTFVGNTSGARGGGILNMSTMTLSNSTFVSNSAVSQGGGIYNWVAGMAIYNSTFSDNYAPPGLGGGIYNDGTMNYVNTIIANSPYGGDCINGGGGVNTVNNNNLVEDGSCRASLNGDPKLGPLANNGGPTQTMVLLAGSSAINAGNNVYCAGSVVNNLDQRGVTRPRGGRCDLGAVESQFSTAAFASMGAQDGWVLESAEASNQGLTTDDSSPNFFLGDDSAKKQYRGILSFNTSSLPDTAVVASVLLKVRQQNIVGGGNPVQFFQGFMIDVKTGTLGTPTVQPADFQTAANASYGPFVLSPVNTWYSINISNAKTLINKLATNNGLTQIRLYFKLDDNNNAIANYLSLFSGDAAPASQPQLIIHYYVP